MIDQSIFRINACFHRCASRIDWRSGKSIRRYRSRRRRLLLLRSLAAFLTATVAVAKQGGGRDDPILGRRLRRSRCHSTSATGFGKSMLPLLLLLLQIIQKTSGRRRRLKIIFCACKFTKKAFLLLSLCHAWLCVDGERKGKDCGEERERDADDARSQKRRAWPYLYQLGPYGCGFISLKALPYSWHTTLIL